MLNTLLVPQCDARNLGITCNIFHYLNSRFEIMSNEMGRLRNAMILNWRIVTHFKILYRYSPGETWENSTGFPVIVHDSKRLTFRIRYTHRAERHSRRTCEKRCLLFPLPPICYRRPWRKSRSVRSSRHGYVIQKTHCVVHVYLL